jgi:hypothetical protein
MVEGMPLDAGLEPVSQQLGCGCAVRVELGA